MESYDFAEKAQYRVKVWNEIEKICRRPKALRTVAYLDTRDGLETRFLLRRGYNPSGLLAINRDPVEVALLTRGLRRDGLPDVRTAGVEWQRAMAETSGTYIVNFDGMGCFHEDLVELMRETVTNARPSIVAVNMLGGREQAVERLSIRTNQELRSTDGAELPKVTTFGKRVNPNHAERVWHVLKGTIDLEPDTCLVHLTSVAWDVYMSESRQPMVWCVAGLKPHSHNDKSWHRVEQQWCLGPNCMWLSDPESYRALHAEYMKLQTVLSPLHNGRDFGTVALELGIHPDELRTLNERAHQIYRKMTLLNTTRHGMDEWIALYKRRHGDDVVAIPQ